MSLIDPSLFKSEPEVGSDRPFGAYSERPPSGVGFKDPRTLTLVLSVFLLLNIAASALFAALGEIYGVESITAGMAALLLLCISLPQFIILMFWFWRTNKNARAISSGIETTPGWAVGYFFIPFVSLFRPFKTMSEIWRSAQAPLSWKSLDDPAILRVWWGCWLAGAIGGMIANISSDGHGPVMWIATALGMAADGLTFWLTRTIARRQWEGRDQSVFD